MGNCMNAAPEETNVSPIDELQETPKIDKKRGDSDKSQNKVVSSDEELVRHWIECSSSTDKIKDANSLASSAFIIHFTHEDIQMPVDQYLDSIYQVHRSFPDFKLTWTSMETPTPGTVTVQMVQGRGTHTGAPFGFGPFPAIPATNIKVVDAPILLTATLRNGKIDKIVCDSKGQSSGLAHFYTQLGGLVI